MAFYPSLGWIGLGATTGAGSSQTQAIAQAISKAEGFGQDPTNIPTSRNNPGDLTNAQGQIITFATPQQGWDALYAQVNAMISGSSAHYNPSMTWGQIGSIYAADPSGTLASNVARQLGVDPNSTLADFLGTTSPVDGTPVASTDGTDQTGNNVFSLNTSDWTTWLLAFGIGFIVVYMFSSQTGRAAEA